MNAVASPWDSRIFGVRVGKLRAEGAPAADMLRAANASAFDVLFVVSDGWVEPDEAIAVDWRYDMAASEPPSAVTAPAGPPDSRSWPSLIELAGEAFGDSRFLRDPGLSAKAAEVYRRWISDALRRGSVLAPPDGGPEAFCVVEEGPEGWRIELVAVSAGARGRGVGRRLLDAAAVSLGPRRRVRVSARNHRAIRFYESAGFRVESVSTAWHIWV